MKHTILVSALLLAFGTASAADIPSWVEPPIDGSKLIDKKSPVEAENTWIGGNYSVTTDPISGNGAGITQITSTEFVMSGNTWLVNNSTSNRVYGAMVRNGADATNGGNIYVQGNTDNYWMTKAVLVEGTGSFTNEKLIYVKNGYGIMAQAGTEGQTLTNDGTIVVEGLGVAMDMAGNDKTSTSVSGAMTNKGDIFLIANEDTATPGEGNIPLIAVRIAEDGEGKFVNTGNIFADGQVAIYVSDKLEDKSKGNIILEGKSHVEGLVDLNGESDLKVSNLDSAETIELADDAKSISIVASTVTIEQGTDKDLNIQTLSASDDSDVDIKLHRVGSAEHKVLTIKEVTEGSVDVGYTGNVSDDLLGGKVSQGNLFYGVSIANDQPDSVTVDQGLMGDEMVLTMDANGNIVSRVTRTNDLLRSAQDLAITNALMWRSQLTNLSDRMGTLRTAPETAGVWARYNNGRLDGMGIEHDYNTVEFGIDKAITDNVTLGVSFDYTKGDTDVVAGSSDNDTYTLGFYGSYFNDAGCFLDAMFKIGRIDTDYDLRTSAGKEKGDYMLTGTIVGIEAGHRWNIQNYFVEPQVQLTYSHLRAEDYTSSIGRDVSFDAMDSLIARVGVMGGINFAQDKGSAYAKVSYNHDFLGDVEGDYELSGIKRTFDDELDDNWGEASIGASYQVTDSINTFVDAGMSFGGDIDQKWRFNVGARYVF